MPKVKESLVAFRDAENMLVKWAAKRNPDQPMILSLDRMGWYVTYSGGANWRYLGNPLVWATELSTRIGLAMQSEADGMDLPDWAASEMPVLDDPDGEHDDDSEHEDDWRFAAGILSSAHGSAGGRLAAISPMHEGTLPLTTADAEDDSAVKSWIDSVTHAELPQSFDPEAWVLPEDDPLEIDANAEAAANLIGHLHTEHNAVFDAYDLVLDNEPVETVLHLQFCQVPDQPLRFRALQRLTRSNGTSSCEQLLGSHAGQWREATSVLDIDSSKELDSDLNHVLGFIMEQATAAPPMCLCAGCVKTEIEDTIKFDDLEDDILLLLYAIDEARTHLSGPSHQWDRIDEDHYESVIAPTREELLTCVQNIDLASVTRPLFDALSAIPSFGQQHIGFGCDASEWLQATVTERLRAMESACALFLIASAADMCCVLSEDDESCAALPADERDMLLDMLKTVMRLEPEALDVIQSAGLLAERLQGDDLDKIMAAAEDAWEHATEALSESELNHIHGVYAPFAYRQDWEWSGPDNWVIDKGDNLPELILMGSDSDSAPVLMMRPPLEGDLLEHWADEHHSDVWAGKCDSIGMDTMHIPMAESYETCHVCKCPLPTDEADLLVECPNCGNRVVTRKLSESGKNANAIAVYFEGENDLVDAALKMEPVFLEWLEQMGLTAAAD